MLVTKSNLYKPAAVIEAIDDVIEAVIKGKRTAADNFSRPQATLMGIGEQEDLP